MTSNLKTTKRQPFIRSQTFLLLDDVPDAAWYLDPQRFREARFFAADQRKEQNAEKPDSRDTRVALHVREQHERWLEHWRPTTRESLFADDTLRRLCLTIDGGIGKTTTLKRIEALQGGQPHDATSGRRLWLYVEIKDLPDSVDQFLPTDRLGRLAEILRHSSDPDAALFSDRRLSDFLRGSVLRGDVTFLIDGLDKTRTPLASKEVSPKIEALAKFLNGPARNCRAIIAGRPHAVTRKSNWDALFKDGSWRFAQMDGFTEEKQRQAYLGAKFDKLKSLDVETMAIPRMLEAIRQRVPAARLDAIHSPSELYAEVIEHIWLEDQTVDHNRPYSNQTHGISKDKGLHLLSAIAMEMFRDGNWEGVAEGEMDDFEQRLFDGHGKSLGYAVRELLHHALLMLGESNSLLDYCFLDVFDQLSDLYFRDTTLQEFFTARYMAKHATAEESEWLGRTAWLPRHPDPELSSENLYRVWRFLAEMPEAHRTPLVWVRALAPLYAPQPVHGLRSCEMLFRSWDTMQSLAHPNPRRGSRLREYEQLAQEVLCKFHGEFSLEILLGGRGIEARRIAEKLLAEFRIIPPNYRGPDQLTFESGLSAEQSGNPTLVVWSDETPRDVQLPGSFELACFPVTNGQYELFEPRHAREFEDRVATRNELDRHPVVNVSWYQVAMFCRWLTPPRQSESGPARQFEYRLPHELEWEFAARAGTRTIRFCCADEADLDAVRTALEKVAHFDGDWNTGHTEPVGILGANPWELHDIYGNVWEWCGNVYSEDPRETLGPSNVHAPSRVCRGGGWCFTPRDVRSSNRSHNHPTNLSVLIGFRVARAS